MTRLLLLSLLFLSFQASAQYCGYPGHHFWAFDFGAKAPDVSLVNRYGEPLFHMQSYVKEQSNEEPLRVRVVFNDKEGRAHLKENVENMDRQNLKALGDCWMLTCHLGYSQQQFSSGSGNKAQHRDEYPRPSFNEDLFLKIVTPDQTHYAPIDIGRSVWLCDNDIYQDGFKQLRNRNGEPAEILKVTPDGFDTRQSWQARSDNESPFSYRVALDSAVIERTFPEFIRTRYRIHRIEVYSKSNGKHVDSVYPQTYERFDTRAECVDYIDIARFDEPDGRPPLIRVRQRTDRSDGQLKVYHTYYRYHEPSERYVEDEVLNEANVDWSFARNAFVRATTDAHSGADTITSYVYEQAKWVVYNKRPVHVPPPPPPPRLEACIELTTNERHLTPVQVVSSDASTNVAVADSFAFINRCDRALEADDFTEVTDPAFSVSVSVPPKKAGWVYYHDSVWHNVGEITERRRVLFLPNHGSGNIRLETRHFIVDEDMVEPTENPDITRYRKEKRNELFYEVLEVDAEGIPVAQGTISTHTGERVGQWKTFSETYPYETAKIYSKSILLELYNTDQDLSDAEISYRAPLKDDPSKMGWNSAITNAHGNTVHFYIPPGTDSIRALLGTKEAVTSILYQELQTPMTSQISSFRLPMLSKDEPYVQMSNIRQPIRYTNDYVIIWDNLIADRTNLAAVIDDLRKTYPEVQIDAYSAEASYYTCVYGADDKLIKSLLKRREIQALAQVVEIDGQRTFMQNQFSAYLPRGLNSRPDLKEKLKSIGLEHDQSVPGPYEQLKMTHSILGRALIEQVNELMQEEPHLRIGYSWYYAITFDEGSGVRSIRNLWNPQN
jgi:hypothetical protein